MRNLWETYGKPVITHGKRWESATQGSPWWSEGLWAAWAESWCPGATGARSSRYRVGLKHHLFKGGDVRVCVVLFFLFAWCFEGFLKVNEIPSFVFVLFLFSMGQ